MDTRRRFQLRTLGRIALLDASGHEDPSLSTRPRKLALLAWLVLRPERRATRDRIIGVFWGDRDEERARNSLSDAVSHLRRVLGRDSIRTQGAEVVIANDAPLDVDALELAAAAFRGDHDAVVSLYRGPFLDGFHVEDAPEFDDWRDRECSLLERLFANSAGVKCADLASVGAWDECCRLAQRWLDAEPASGDATLALLRAIAAPGTHACLVATLAAFEKLQARLARDLGIAPDERASAFAKDIADRLAQTPPPPITSSAVDSRGAARVPIGPSRHWRPTGFKKAATLASFATLGAVVLLVVMASRSRRLDRRRVIVAAFQNRTGDSTLRALGAVAADWVSRGLTETRVVEVADPLLAPTDSITDPRLIGRRAQAGVVVLGEYTRQGDSLEMDARLVDANTGRVLRATPSVVARVTEPIAAVDVIRQRITGAMAAEVDPLIASVAREGSQPPTYDAYLAWIEGIDRYAHRDYHGAIEPLGRAAANDSTFVSPRIWLAGAYTHVGDHARADSILRRIAPLRGRMAPLDRGLLDGWLASLRGDLQAVYASGRDVLAAAPGSELAIYKAGEGALEANRPNEAVRLLRQLRVENSALTWDVYGTHLAPALHMAGRHDEELIEATRRLAHGPGSEQARAERATALIALGRIAEAAQVIRRILEMHGDSDGWPGYPALALGQELVVHGHPAEARAVYAQAEASARALPPGKANTRSGRALLMASLYGSDQLARADSVAGAALLTDSTWVDALRFHGLVAARLGDVAAADQASARLAALTTPYLFGVNSIARGADRHPPWAKGGGDAPRAPGKRRGRDARHPARGPGVRRAARLPAVRGADEARGSVSYVNPMNRCAGARSDGLPRTRGRRPFARVILTRQ